MSGRSSPLREEGRDEVVSRYVEWGRALLLELGRKCLIFVMRAQ